VWFSLTQQSPAQLEKYEILRKEFSEKIRPLADECDSSGQTELAETLRQWVAPRDPWRQYFFCPNALDEWPRDDSSSPEWARSLAAARREYAGALYELARRSAAADQESSAFAWLHEVCVFQPDHAEARRILGYRQHDGLWTVGPVKQRRPRSRQPLVGWLAADYTIVESPHYSISSAATPEATLQLLENLERWRMIWRQAFYEYWSQPGSLRNAFENKSGVPAGDKLKVIAFADRNQYVRELAALGVAGVEKSTGFYSDRHEAMFVYWDSPPPLETWRQEQAHQLFQESTSARRDPVARSHVWAVEGIAMYFESMVEFPQLAALGGFDYGRLQFARVHWTRERFFVPFAELNGLGREAFQARGDVAKLYSQAAGMSLFLMASDKYRPAMQRLVKAIYQRRARPDSLAELCQVPLGELENQYKEFLAMAVADAEHFLFDPERRTELALGFSDVGDSIAKQLERCPNLRWLQLSATQVGDAIGPSLSQLQNLEQLFLDRTQVTDRIVESLARLDRLEELDLADTPISDAGLAQVGRLEGLKALWLAGTDVTDQGLEQLSSLKNLQFLDLARTQVSPEALRRLRERLPQLQPTR
jgi:hypothetical protein